MDMNVRFVDSRSMVFIVYSSHQVLIRTIDEQV